MTLNTAQFAQLVENYAQHIIDGLDNDSMEVMLFDLLTREYETYTEEFIVNEIEDLYGEEVATDLLESVAVADEVSVSWDSTNIPVLYHHELPGSARPLIIDS